MLGQRFPGSARRKLGLVGALLGAFLLSGTRLALGDAHPPQKVTALWSSPQHLDLFITDARGEVASTWWEFGCGWQPWFTIHPDSATSAPGQPVTAVWSNSQHLDLFVTGHDGRVMSTWWEAAKSWQPWFAIHPESGIGAPGQPVTAVWSNPQHLDLFITGRDGRVMSTWWEGAKGWQPWFAVHPESATANTDAIYRKPLPGTYPFWEAGKEVPGVDCRTPQTDPLKAERCTVLNGWGQHLGSGSTPGCFLPVSCYQFDQGMGPNIHAGFVFWDGFPTISKGRLYALAEKDFLKSFEYDKSNGHVSEVPAAENQRIRTPDGMPGGALSVSSDWGSRGVLWVSTHDEDALSYVHPGHFYAVDASNLKILWEDSKIEFFAKFNAPIIADGKVFLATWGRSPNNNPDVQVKSAVVVYGLKP
jgi:hypothetical protein